MQITVTVNNADDIHGRLTATLDGKMVEAPCAIGRGGVKPAEDKREGDGATPLGSWPIRRIYYRADRIERPDTGVPVDEINDSMGWCDAPDHPSYNQLVALPFDASHELMARDDHLYDLVVVLGHNDDPPVPDMGSAIFWHLKRGDEDPASWKPTAGCVATTLPVLYELLAACDETSVMRVVMG
ncbi:MAG: L,D-transpeptidase family protein [Alphaproteobacteria bacterium]|nr:L,D-transpeptidase family protein [Alphaproteobacteria bacterium SS10]